MSLPTAGNGVQLPHCGFSSLDISGNASSINTPQDNASEEARETESERERERERERARERERERLGAGERERERER